jgi:glycosyltransferase involved in cell wall biosynthesis
MAWIMALEARRLCHYERQLAHQYDQLTVSSSLDRDAIGSYDNIHVIPNGVDIEKFPFVEGERKSALIAFTGRMGYFPNADAAIWFADKVFPSVRQQLPQAQFFVVGADPTPEVQSLAQRPGVSVTGYVSSIQDYLHEATIAVAPMQAGSGMQFKVIEAMCCGAPIVATSYALGGIKARDGEHLLIAKSSDIFAEQVVRLLQDVDLQRHLAYNARRLVEEKYTWERAVAMLEDVYRLALE